MSGCWKQTSGSIAPEADDENDGGGVGSETNADAGSGSVTEGGGVGASATDSVTDSAAATTGSGRPFAFASKKGVKVGTRRASIQRRFPFRTLSVGSKDPSLIQVASSPNGAS